MNFQGAQFIVTAGPTYEPIDPVRFIGNYSSGKMGYALAEALAEAGAKVILVSGPTHLQISSPRISKVNVKTAEDMYEVCINLFPDCAGAVLAAAVSDFKVKEAATEKIKKGESETLTLELVKTPDILAALGRLKKKTQLLVGFSLETQNEKANALSKLQKKNCDIIVLNSLRTPGAGFGTDTNEVTILDRRGGEKKLPLLSKKETAKEILDYMMMNE